MEVDEGGIPCGDMSHLYGQVANTEAPRSANDKGIQRTAWLRVLQEAVRSWAPLFLEGDPARQLSEVGSQPELLLAQLEELRQYEQLPRWNTLPIPILRDLVKGLTSTSHALPPASALSSAVLDTVVFGDSFFLNYMGGPSNATPKQMQQHLASVARKTEGISGGTLLELSQKLEEDLMSRGCGLSNSEMFFRRCGLVRHDHVDRQ